MREIKFRVWDARDRVWLSSDKANVEVLNILTHVDEVKEYGYVRYIPNQYTGLKDKNGKEIYEGDIVKAKDTDNKYYCREVVNGFKEWGVFFYRYDPFKYISSWGPEYLKDKEVVGNIYENPELLETK